MGILMAKCHGLNSDERPSDTNVAGCWMFVEKFLLKANTFLEEFSKDFLVEFADKFREQAIMKSSLNDGLSFCHNDVLVGNILWDGQKVNFIDYEYSGWNFAAFDVA